MVRQILERDYETPKLDKFGRLTIPARYRKILKLSKGDSVAIVYDPNFEGLVLTPIDISKGRRT